MAPHIRPSVAFLLYLLITVLLRTAPAAGQTITLTDLGTLGGAQAAAHAVNEAGEVVGWSNRPGSGAHYATLWRDGHVIDLAAMCTSCFGFSEAYDINDAGQAVGWSSAGAVLWNLTTGKGALLKPLPGDSSSQAFAINNAGQVVGQSAGGGKWRAVIWQPGATVPMSLGVLGTPSSGLIDANAHDINDAGQVVGFSITATGARHAFLWQSGVMTDLGTGPAPPPGCGAADSWGGGINELGDVSGYSKFGCATHAAKWVDGVVQALPGPGRNTSYATFHTINDAGDVSGTASGWCGYHAVIWRNGAIIDLGALPGSCWSLGFGINNRGQVAGYGYDRTGSVTRALLWTTEPPDTDAPLISVPDSFSAEATGPDGATVSWTATAEDAKDGTVAVGCTPQSPALLALGSHTVECTASDAAGNTADTSFVIAVVDTTPPSLSEVTPSAASLWPANHALVTITLDYDVADTVSDVTCALTAASNEAADATGDGDTGPDSTVFDAAVVQLRAERAGTGSGRVYTLTVTCSDAAGNPATRAAFVTVPKSQRHR